MVAPEGRVGRKQGDALRFASPIHSSHYELGLASEEGEEDTRGHREEM